MSANKARDLLQLALGSPAEPDPGAALNILLEGLQAEAGALTDETSVLGDLHLYRIMALKDFVDQYMVVTWRETDEDRAATKQGLHVVQPGELS